MTWRPLLSAGLAEQAFADARRIADVIRHQPDPAEVLAADTPETAVSIARGAAGFSIAMSALADSGLAPDGADEAVRLLGAAAELVAREEIAPDLFDGFAGVAWAHALLSVGTDNTDEDSLTEIDSVLLSLVEPSSWEGTFDLVSGVVGFGVYALGRFPRPSAVEALERIVEVLGRSARACDGGLAWKTVPAFLTPFQRERSPDGYFDLGVAHGVPGVVGFLAQICAAGAGDRKARELLEGGVTWLLAQRSAGFPRFPYWRTETGEGRDSRSAWCYGDPGVAAVLLLAARCVREKRWEEAALELALGAASRCPEDSGVIDAGLCHGAAGLAHVLNRIYQRTGVPEIRDAAVGWFERTLSMRFEGAGYAGYRTARKGLDGVVSYVDDASLLTGVAGIALALAAAATPPEPAWDRFLLLSSPFEP